MPLIAQNLSVAERAPPEFNSLQDEAVPPSGGSALDAVQTPARGGETVYVLAE